MEQPNNKQNSAPTEQQDWVRAQNLIPAYLKKTLSADDQAWMAYFLTTLQAKDSEKAMAFQQEIEWVGQTQAMLVEVSPKLDATVGWQKMSHQIDEMEKTMPTQFANQPTQDKKKSLFQTLFSLPTDLLNSKRKSLVSLWQKPAVGIFASAIIVSQMGLLAAVVRQLHQAENTTVSTTVTPATGSKAVEGANVLQVTFKDTASLLEVRVLLSQVHAQVVGGPGALGIWEIAVPQDETDNAVKQITASKLAYSVTKQ